MNGRRASWILLLAIATLIAADIRAEPPPELDWEAQLMAFGWLVSIHADVSAGTVDSTIDVRIGDINF